MNKAIENAMGTRETAAVEGKIRGLDLCTGDTVQIRGGQHAGRVGVVLGVSYCRENDRLSYCVKFSDSESVRFPAGSLRLVRPHDNED